MKDSENKSILFKNVDLVVAYLIIFSFALALILFVTNYLDSKVKEFAIDANISTNE